MSPPHALADEIAGRLPTQAKWQRQDNAFATVSPGAPTPRWLEIEVRRHGDVDVRFHLDGTPGSPFELHFPIGESDRDAVRDAIIEFVIGVLDERVVLVVVGGWLRGGRRFIDARELQQHPPRRIRFAASWNGTFDDRVRRATGSAR